MGDPEIESEPDKSQEEEDPQYWDPSVLTKKDYVPPPRPEHPYIVEWIKKDSKVLDLGCGIGQLGYYLVKNKPCKYLGVDNDPTAVKYCNKINLKAVVGNLDTKLDFEDNEFDYVILSGVVEHLYNPELALQEACRVGKYLIIVFPNMGHWLARAELAILGEFPKLPLFSYRWYNTKHIHLFSYRDFVIFVNNNIKGQIVRKKFLGGNSKDAGLLANLFPNLFSLICIVMVEK